MTSTNKKMTTDALEILDYEFFKGKPEMYALLQDAREDLLVAQKIYDLREEQSLTQKELAERAGTSRTVIARLEGAGYDRHTLTTLRKIARAMNHYVKIEFVPMPDTETLKGKKIGTKAKPRKKAAKAAKRPSAEAKV